MTGMELIAPGSRELWDGMPLAETVLLEKQAEAVVEGLRQYNAERFYAEYSEHGKATKSQRAIAEELGVSHVWVGKLMQRAGVEPKQPKRPKVETSYHFDESAPDLADVAEEVVTPTEAELPDGRIVDMETGEVIEPVPPAPLRTSRGSKVVLGVKFPEGGIVTRTDVSEYVVSDISEVFRELLRRATPEEALGLAQVLRTLAERAEKKGQRHA